MNKEGIEIMSDMNLHVNVLEMEIKNCNEILGESMKDTEKLKQQIEKLKQKYNKFKKEVSTHIFEEIIENVPTDPEYIENNWEDNFDNFIEEFEEEWDDV